MSTDNSFCQFSACTNEIPPEKPLTGEILWRISAKSCHNQSWAKKGVLCVCVRARARVPAHVYVIETEKEKEIVYMH